MDSRFDFIEQLNYHAEDVSKNFKIDEPVNLDALFNPNPPPRTAAQEKIIEFFEDYDPIHESNVNKRIFEKNADLLRGGLSVILPEQLPESAIEAFKRASKIANEEKQKNSIAKKIPIRLKNKNWLEQNRISKLKALEKHLDREERIVEDLWRDFELEKKELESSYDQWMHEMHQEALWRVRHSLTAEPYAFESYFMGLLISKYNTLLTHFRFFVLSKFTTEEFHCNHSIPELITTIKSFLFVWRNSLKTDSDPLVDPLEKSLMAYLKDHPIYFMHEAKILISKYLDLKFKGILLNANDAYELKEIEEFDKKTEQKYEVKSEHKSITAYSTHNILKNNKTEDQPIVMQRFDTTSQPADIKPLPQSNSARETSSDFLNIFQRFFAWINHSLKKLFSRPLNEEKHVMIQLEPTPQRSIFKMLGIKLCPKFMRNEKPQALLQTPNQNELISLNFAPKPPAAQKMDEEDLEFKCIGVNRPK